MSRRLKPAELDALAESVARALLNNARIADYLLQQQTMLLEQLFALVNSLNAQEPTADHDPAAAVEATEELLRRLKG